MFWNRFYELCIENNTKPNPVCKELGFSTATATHWKKGQLPGLASLDKIAKHFNVSVDYLLGKTDIKEKQVTQDEQPVSDDMKLLIEKSSTLSPDEIAKTLEYVEFLKSQRK